MSVGKVWLVALLSVSAAACIVVRRKSVRVVQPGVSQTVASPFRVFMADGSVVLFRQGAVITDSAVTGQGVRYDLFRLPSGAADTVPLDSVLGIEAFSEPIDPGLTLLASVGATAVTIGAGIALACAADPKCFGSCPTIYSTHAGADVLEAEAFSYSISPLLEGRDLDHLSVAADTGGEVRLEIRNEALETHYINQIELIEVRHAFDERVLPDVDRQPAVVGSVHAFEGVRDRAGRDVSATLRAADRDVFSTITSRIVAVTPDDTRDWIEAVVPPVDADTVAVVLKLRNSLLNTVLFYDLMLGNQGARALDWMARDIGRIGAAVELGAWYRRTMGLRLEVETDDGFQEVARLGDTGPIAWSEITFRLPSTRGEATRFRLTFLADEWRIDRLGWSARIGRPATRAIPAAEIVPVTGDRQPDLVSRVATADDEYIVTTAGTGFIVRFDVGSEPAAGQRSFLFASQGYYTEWVRPHWIRTGGLEGPFRPTPDVVPELMSRWLELKPAMEEAFYATRIPVR